MAVSYGDRYSVEQQILEEQEQRGQDAITNAVNLAGTRGAGMMLRARGIGESRGEMYNALGRMLTGEEEPTDPRLARQNALQKIFEQYGDPQNYEDMVKIANVLRTSGFPDEADLAMKQANDYKTAQTNALNANTSANKAPTRDTVDYVKEVNGKQVVYTKTVQYNPSNQQWDFISEAPKYAPDKPTATMQDMMFHASKVQNKDGTVGCNLDEESCWIAATDLYHATAVKEDSFDEEFGKSAGQDVAKRYESAKSSVDAINTIDASFNALNSGDPITGFASDMRLGLAKMIGAISGDENKDVQATEVWLATTGKLVADLLASGAFGSGTGLSDNDVKFAKAMQGGDVTLDENSIRRILFMRRQLENKVITNWNETYQSYPNSVKKNMNQFYSDEQIYQAEKPLDPNTVYIKPPKGFFIYPESNSLLGTDEYFWPATEYDVDTVEYNGTRWTVHNKNGIDLTREYIELYNQGQE